MRPHRSLALVLALPLLAASADAATRRVPKEYATIQAAVDAAGAGDVIEIAKGTYDENVQVIGRTGLTFVGKGKKTRWKTTSGDALFIDTSAEIAVRKIEFRAEGDGVRVYSSDHVLVDACRFVDCGDTGVVFADVRESTVRKSLFRWSEPPPEVLAPDAITLAQHDGGVCIDCVVARNDIRYAGRAIGETFGTVRTTIVKNTIRDGNYGITTADDGVVAGNVVRGMTRRGITNLGDAVSVLDNVVREVDDEGILVSVGPDMVVAGNAIEKAGTGVEVGSATNAHVFANEIAKTAGDGLYVRSDAVGAHLTDNDVVKAGASGVHVEGAGHVFVGNSAKKCGAFDLNDETDPGDNVFVGNEFPHVAP